MSDDFILIPHRSLADFARSILETTGVPVSTASLVADSLVAANLRGVDSHGVQLLLWYTDQIQSGNIDVHHSGHIATESGACMVYDGEDGIGQPSSEICREH